MYLLAIFLPRVAMLLCGKSIQAVLNLFLMFALWVPGVVHAFMIVSARNTDKRNNRLIPLSKTVKTSDRSCTEATTHVE
jgi:uncharacterized membrane protein YqaE (UPF0057 family)